MDVKWLHTYLREKPGPGVEPNYISDVDAAAKVAAVDLSDIKNLHADWFTVCDDTTVIDSPGTITRAITATLTATFLVEYPNQAERTAALRGLFHQALARRTPVARVPYEEISYGDPLCPPIP